MSRYTNVVNAARRDNEVNFLHETVISDVCRQMKLELDQAGEDSSMLVELEQVRLLCGVSVVLQTIFFVFLMILRAILAMAF
jgi:hypothetical protein